MLQIIRDKTTGWIATAIMLLLIIPFAFWGINYYFAGGKAPVVATVNGEDIKLAEFQRSYTNYRQQMQQYLGKNLTAAEEEALKLETLNKLVESKLLDQVNASFGLQISDQQVKQAIKGIEIFQSDGKFSNEMYQLGLMQLGMSPALYEHQIRLDMMSEQLQSTVIDSEISTGQEARAASVLVNQTRDIHYALIPVDRYKESIAVSEQDIDDFYNEHVTRYFKPEQVKVAYINLSMNKLAEQVTVKEDELLEYYEDNKSSYDQEEQRKITQILFKTEENATEEQLASAKDEADKVLAAIESGKSFQDIAAVYKENKETNFSITEYGFLPKGILQPEVDKAVYSMQMGSVSKVIESKLGFHIVKLIDIKGGVMNTFENNREKAETDYRMQKAESNFFDLADQLANLAYEHPDSLEVAASETGLTVQESDWFDRSGTEEGLTADPKVIDAAFSEDVLGNRHNSDVVEVSDGNLVVLRVLEHSPRARRPLDEVRDTIISDIKFTRARDSARELGQKIIDELESGKDFAAIAETHNVKWEEADGIKRDDISVNRAVLRTAFTAGLVEEGGAIYDGVEMGSGDFAVMAITGVHNPDPESFKGKTVEETRIKIEAYRAANSWVQFLEQLKAEADITLFTETLQ